MSKVAKNTLLVIIILIIIFLIAWPKLDFLGKESANAQPVQRNQMAIPVNAKIVKPERLENKLNVTGSVIANESLQLRCESSGKITGIFFEEGDFIKKGKLMVQINDDELKAQRAKLVTTQKLLKDTEFRQKRLLEREAISQEEYDRAFTELKGVEADMQVIDAQIARSKVIAPFDGIVGLRLVSLGTYITSSDPIATFYNIDPIKVEFSVPGKYLNKIKRDDVINFKVEGQPESFTGKIYAIEPEIDPVTRTLKLRAISPNKERKLVPGQFARIEVILEAQENALMAPTEAVVPELTGHKVYLYKNGKSRLVSVEIGIRTERDVEIISGIAASDTLITSGVLQINDGSSVNINTLN